MTSLTSITWSHLFTFLGAWPERRFDRVLRDLIDFRVWDDPDVPSPSTVARLHQRMIHHVQQGGRLTGKVTLVLGDKTSCEKPRWTAALFPTHAQDHPRYRQDLADLQRFTMTAALRQTLRSSDDINREASGHEWGVSSPRSLKTWTPLSFAIALRAYVAIEILLQHGADPMRSFHCFMNDSYDMPGPDFGWSPLHELASLDIETDDVLKDLEAILALLARYGADVNATDARGRTPLHVALLHGDERLVPALLRAGANSNAWLPPYDPASGLPPPSRPTGVTPLHCSLTPPPQRHFQLETLSALLQAGADPARPNGDNMEPLAILDVLGHGYQWSPPNHQNVRRLLEQALLRQQAGSIILDDASTPLRRRL